jgi:hypothetical protein
MEVPEHKRFICGDGNGCETVAVSGGEQGMRPGFGRGERQMSEFAGKGTVVIAANDDDFGAAGEIGKRPFDPLALRRARAGRVNDIAEENEATRREFIAEAEELVARAGIGEGPEFTAAALSPTVAEMKIGDKRGFGIGEPERTGDMGLESGKN